MAGSSLVGRARAGAGVALAEITAARPWSERLVAVLHLLTSLVLSALYLAPAALLAMAVVTVTISAVGTLQGLLTFAGAARGVPEDPVDGAAHAVLNSPPAVQTVAFAAALCVLATLLARLGCHVQRRRLESVFGVVETGALGPARPRGHLLRAVSYVLGRDAWSAVYLSTIAGLQGLVSGGVAVVLVVYGTAASIGSLIGLGYAMVGGAPEDIAAPLAVTVIGPAAALAGLWLVPPLLRLEVAVTRRLLFDAPETRMRRRLVEVQNSRSRMVDAAEAERRRIERDLHDGAQQRLLAVTMTLTRAQARFDHDPDQARALLDEARTEAKAVMAELREVARGLHPKALTDHGLEAALPVAAGRCPLPVRMEVDLPARPSRRAEGVAYYVACEALTNVAKHANAATVTLRADRAGDDGAPLLRLTVTDDGVGGADPDAGTGLYGLWDRVNAVDGTLRVRSPEGGGTVLTAEIPWEA